MIKIENVSFAGVEEAIRGMRNPLESWMLSDSYATHIEDEKTLETAKYEYFIGEKDHSLMMRLRNAGTDHRFMRMMVVYVDLTAPLYWWKEFDTYKIGTVANSCSTMHCIHKKPFEIDDFSHEHLSDYSHDGELCVDFLWDLQDIINSLNTARELFIETKDKKWWWQMIQLLPSSYNQRRTVMLNYEVLANIYPSRQFHKLDEWRTFCGWIETLPYSELITGEFR